MAKFIELTKKFRSTKVMINLDDVSLIEPSDLNDNETDITFKDSAIITFEESYDLVKNICERIYND